MIYIGDCHGKTERLTGMLRSSAFQGKRAFQLGDMGLGFKGVLLPEFERERFLFIRGNHDSPSWCREHPNYVGDFGYLAEERLFYLGGAWSIDHAYRIKDISWWEDEELPLDALDAAYQLYVSVKPEIVATHEAPSKAAFSMLSKIVSGAHLPCPTDQGVRLKGDEYAYYKQKLGCANTRTSQALQRMFEEHQPRYWVFGHYHLDTTFKIDTCEFSCLNELSTKELEL